MLTSIFLNGITYVWYIEMCAHSLGTKKSLHLSKLTYRYIVIPKWLITHKYINYTRKQMYLSNNNTLFIENWNQMFFIKNKIIHTLSS